MIKLITLCILLNGDSLNGEYRQLTETDIECVVPEARRRGGKGNKGRKRGGNGLR